MIRHDSHDYRIEEYSNTPMRFALDLKEYSHDTNGVKWTHFKNLAWFDCYEHACKGMADHVLAREDANSRRSYNQAKLLRGTLPSED